MPVSSFAFRMPDTYKAAAKALAATHFLDFRYPDRPDYCDHVAPTSINEALLYLVRRGMAEAQIQLERQIATAKAEMAIHDEIVGFLIGNPAASEARSFNFPEGSPAREFLEGLEAQDDCLGWDRAEGLIELGACQDRVNRLVVALGAIQKAITLKA